VRTRRLLKKTISQRHYARARQALTPMLNCKKPWAWPSRPRLATSGSGVCDGWTFYAAAGRSLPGGREGQAASISISCRGHQRTFPFSSTCSRRSCLPAWSLLDGRVCLKPSDLQLSQNPTALAVASCDGSAPIANRGTSPKVLSRFMAGLLQTMDEYATVVSPTGSAGIHGPSLQAFGSHLASQRIHYQRRPQPHRRWPQPRQPNTRAP
jgi:hypothetical protein